LIEGARNRANWPFAQASEQLRAGPHHWHIQRLGGNGPKVLFLHGTGASTHSWAPLMPLLQHDIAATLVDLPGHGLTKISTGQRSSLTYMAQDLLTLCQTLQFQPDFIVGHSAGAALALEMSKSLALKGVVGLNPALSKFPGLAGVMFPMMAKMMALNPLTPRYLAGLAKSKSRVRQILSGTGSDLAEDQINLYQKLFSDKTHVKGTILMMSQWNLDRLLAQLNTVDTPCLFIASTRDRTVPCADVKATAERMRNTAYHELNGLGHLAHEEDPQKVAGLLSAFFKQKRAALSQTSA